jgi:hypothetical protein
LEPTRSTAPHLEHTRSTAPHLEHTRSTAPHLEPTRSTAPHLEPTRSTAPHLEHTRSTAPHLEHTRSTAPHLEPTHHEPLTRFAELPRPVHSDEDALGGGSGLATVGVALGVRLSQFSGVENEDAKTRDGRDQNHSETRNGSHTQTVLRAQHNNEKHGDDWCHGGA